MVRAAAYALRYMQRILVLNPKGGSGKTTIATNLASYFASQGDRPLLSDNDPQGSEHSLAEEAHARAGVHPRRSPRSNATAA